MKNKKNLLDRFNMSNKQHSLKTGLTMKIKTNVRKVLANSLKIKTIVLDEKKLLMTQLSVKGGGVYALLKD